MNPDSSQTGNDSPLSASFQISRRKLLGHLGAISAGYAAVQAGAASAADSPGAPNDSERRKLKIVVAGGHPGDPEYGCGGTVARFTDLGHEVTLLYLNDGGWGETPGTARMAEAAAACEILKARPAYAGQRNGHAIVDEAHYEEFGKILQAEKPDAVFTQWPIDNHRDHRAITMLVYDAWRQSKHSFSLYYYEVSNGEDTLQFSPTHYVDIKQTEPRKKGACYAHASQTPDRYYELQDGVAKFRGIESGHERAEAFILQIRSPADVLGAFANRSA
jgi:LmbE family N-acetylglucosaminyl deacetylase